MTSMPARRVLPIGKCVPGRLLCLYLNPSRITMLIKGMGNISNASSIMVKQCDSSIHPWLRPARTAARIARPRTGPAPITPVAISHEVTIPNLCSAPWPCPDSNCRTSAM